ncbi:MAG: imidazole glycerol phosphate synthase subunit HisH [Blastocatellia bacterium]
MKVAVVKYNAGNIASVTNALSRLGVETLVTDVPEELNSADRVIFPGVGEASTAMKYLKERQLDTVIRSLTQPVLGICLGMHLLCELSEENNTTCLGVVSSQVRKFGSKELKIPHTGWNTIGEFRSRLFDGVDEGSHVYFVHGYFVETGKETTAACRYGTKFSAAFQHNNFHAVQFHPEKSGAIGQRILENFLNL